MDDAGYGSVRTNQDTLAEQISAKSIKNCAFDSGLKSRRAEARRRCGLVDLTNYFGVEMDDAGYRIVRTNQGTHSIKVSNEFIQKCAFERRLKSRRRRLDEDAFLSTWRAASGSRWTTPVMDVIDLT